MEIELKLRLDPTVEHALSSLTATPTKQHLRSLYYDTPAGELTAAGIALRVRRIDDAWVQTVKSQQKCAFERFEFEEIVGGQQPQADALPTRGTPIGDLLAHCMPMLEPMFETDFDRTAWVVQAQSGLVAEVARDVGTIRYAAQEEPIAEVELELKRGTREQFYRWAADFVRQNRAGLIWPTKGERGLRLAARIPNEPAVQTSQVSAPAAAVTSVAAATEVLRACMMHALANVPVMLACDTEGGPHQFRVGLRRLRAAIRFFLLREHHPVWVSIDQRLSACAAVAGHVRDCDVLKSGLLVKLSNSFPGDAALVGLDHALTRQAQEYRAQARAYLGSDEFSALVLETLAEIENLPAVQFAEASFGELAQSRVAQLSKKVQRRRRTAVDEAGWHRVRIAVKNLRYGLEFGRSALRAAGADSRSSSGDHPISVDPVLKALSRWQDRLGQGQDLAVARQVAAQALHQSELPAHSLVRAVALIDGWRAFSRARDGRSDEAGKRAVRALRRLIEAQQAGAAAGNAAGAGNAGGVTADTDPIAMSASVRASLSESAG
jgi:inorganic triphosphatase YgiF